MSKNRYTFLHHSGGKPGWCTVIDKEHNFYVEFEAHRFNDTQQVHVESSEQDANEVARWMSELGDWLCLHHYAEIFPVPTYELRLSEDDTELHIIRHKDPTMDARFETHDIDDIARALSKASEFVRKVVKPELKIK